MNPPATVKLLKLAPFAVATLAFISFDLPQAAVLGQPTQSTQPVSKSDGLYLYGETPQPNQLSKGYVVFQHQQGKVVGAIYTPNSEFECFTGSQTNTTLDVKSKAMGSSQAVAAKINLSNLHQIKSITANEESILSVCKQEAVTSTNK